MAKKRTSQLAPGAWKSRLADRWFPGVEELYNKGVVDSVEDLLSRANSPEAIKRLEEEAVAKGIRWTDRFKGFFKGPVKEFFTETIPAGAKKAGEAYKKSVGEQFLGKPEETKRISHYTDEQLQLMNLLGQLAQQNIPQELELLKQQRETPYLQQAFGELGGTAASGLGGVLTGLLAKQPSSQYTSGLHGGNQISGPILSALLGSLAGYGFQPQIQQYGSNAFNYLTNLANRGA